MFSALFTGSKRQMLVKLVDKVVSIRKLVLKDILIFLIKAYLKSVINNFREVNHCKVDLYNICISYVKFTNSKDTFLWQFCYYNIFETSLSSIMAILLAIHSHRDNIIT